MNSGPRHARKKAPRRSLALLRAGLTVSAAGAAVAVAGGAAGAAPAAAAPAAGAADSAQQRTPLGTANTALLQDPAGTTSTALTEGATASLAPVQHLQLNPLAKTGTDPLDNVVGTQIADFKPVSTAAVTGPLARGDSLSELPVVGAASGAVLPG